MKSSQARVLLGLGVPVFAAAVGYIPFLALWSELPNPLASHFTSSGVPDGSMSPLAFVGFTTLMFAAGAIMCAGAALYAKPIAGIASMGIAVVGGFLSGFASGLLLETAITQRGLDSWRDATLSWTFAVVAVLLGLGVAAIAARLGSAIPGLQPVVADGPRPVMDLGEGEQAVWSASLRSSVLTWLGIAGLFFTGFLALATSEWTTVVVILVSTLALLSIAKLTVRADRGGLHVRYGLLPWPRTNVGVDEISHATVIDVRPRQWGGWGYRGSLTFMKQAAVVLRAGPGIRLDLRNGKVFVVTVDNPETAVGLLNAQVQRLNDQGAAISS